MPKGGMFVHHESLTYRLSIGVMHALLIMQHWTAVVVSPLLREGTFTLYECTKSLASDLALVNLYLLLQ